VLATFQTPATPDQKNAILKTVAAASLLQRFQSNEVSAAVRNEAIRDLKTALAKRDWLTPSMDSLKRFPLLLSVANSICLYGLLVEDSDMTTAIRTWLFPTRPGPRRRRQTGLGSSLECI
jgi:hypothetical protein